MLAAPLAFEKAPRSLELTEKSRAMLRAVAALLNTKPELMLLGGVRATAERAGPLSPAAEQEALSRSSAVVLQLRSLTHRDDVAESVSFSAVAKLPGAAQSGVGLGTSLIANKPKPKPSPKP